MCYIDLSDCGLAGSSFRCSMFAWALWFDLHFFFFLTFSEQYIYRRTRGILFVDLLTHLTLNMCKPGQSKIKKSTSAYRGTVNKLRNTKDREGSAIL